MEKQIYLLYEKDCELDANYNYTINFPLVIPASVKEHIAMDGKIQAPHFEVFPFAGNMSAFDRKKNLRFQMKVKTCLFSIVIDILSMNLAVCK